jgi:hypothetical protein
MPSEPVNEITFVARLGTVTALRAERRRQAGELVLIATGEVEERQVDANGRVRRCDIRLNSVTGRKLASGEMKRPEVPEGRDVRNESLREDARRKAVARGLPFYFTCNMAEVVLYAVASRPGEDDREENAFQLAPITRSSQVDAYRDQISQGWNDFLDDLEARLVAMGRTRPSVTSSDVIALRDAIYAIADEAISRVVARLEADSTLIAQVQVEASDTFGFKAALEPSYRAQFREELLQILRFGIFVVAQKLVLYRVLADTGPRRRTPFQLDDLVVPRNSTDPLAIRNILDAAVALAIRRSRDYETAFLPEPLADLVFLEPRTPEEIQECRVGEVWYALLEAVQVASWVSISQNLVGFLYEVIVEPQFRHQLGQFYTREDVVDILVTFAVQNPTDIVLDPAAGGGSFLRSVYTRKRELGDTHENALGGIWGFEITAFAAELSTITLATSDTREPAAYPRVILRDFFDTRPGLLTDLEIPGIAGKLRIPSEFDAVVGNPPYISYRHQTNQAKVLNALAILPHEIALPQFSGKSDAYVWFLVHATQFLRNGGRLAFVVSSALLFADYGIPLIQFLAKHYKIRAVIDSIVERWFPDADTNTALLLLERSSDPEGRRANEMRFLRLRRPLAQLLPAPGDPTRRAKLEDLLDDILTGPEGNSDPRMSISSFAQGEHGGLVFSSETPAEDEDEEE